jgi:TP901 family phage tail tape measure protein
MSNQKAYEIAFQLGASVNSSVRTAFANVNKSLSDMNGRTGGVSKTMNGLGIAIGTTAAALGTLTLGVGAAAKQFDEYNSAMKQIQASTGTSMKGMKEIKSIATNLYNDNLGEDWNDLANAISATKSVTKLSGKELENATANAIAYRDTFGEDIQESIKATDTMMRNFGVTSEEAYNLLAQGAQNGLNKSGELLDSANEYAPQFAALGFNANQMFDTFVAGAESGAFNLDKVGDAIKEFNIRAKDGSKTSVEAFQALGMNADQMMQTFAKGGPEAQKSFQTVVKAISSIEDPVKKNEIGVALMGTQFEDLEADVVAAMGKARNQFDMTKETMEGIKDIKYDSFGMALQGIGRQVETGLLIPLGKKLLPHLNNFANWIASNIPKVQNFFEQFGNKASGTFNKIMGVAGPVMTFVGQKVMEVVSLIVSWWKTNGAQLLSNVQIIFNGIWKVIQFIMPVVLAIIETVWGNIKGVISGALNIISGAIKLFAGIFTGDFSKMWEGIKQLFSGAVQFVWNLVNLMMIGRLIKGIKTFATTFVSLLKGGWDNAIGGLKAFASGAKQKFDDFVKAGKEKFDEIVKLAKSLPGKIGKGIVDNLANATSAMKNLAENLITKFKKSLGINSPSKVFTELGGWIIKGLTNGLTVDNLKSLGKSVFADFGDGILNSWDAIKGFLTGGGGSSSGGTAKNSQVESWVRQALAITGTDLSWLPAMMTKAQKESGFNPRAINLWDSNAKRGTPSKGLFQTIDPTFDAYKLSGMNDIYNPVHNAVAAIRYIKDRYGTVFNTPGIKSMANGGGYKGYYKGGNVPNTQWAWVGERGPELLKLPGGSQVFNNDESESMMSRILSFGKGDSTPSSGSVQNDQSIEFYFNPKIIVEGNADEAAIQRAIGSSYEEFKRFMKQWQRDNKRIPFNS